ncbi:hypothetical protein HRI_003236600 [Hibiscus trionum]|uniref:Disease resistance protein At4g27190-like leucine-rich repeats domain-containing protein n=1 Tax=Hibiscus trionum TaxID=183268 RepID=A0A9W7MBU2_HIBTR|nr:hypothetical protein HRI_003236600 [Hibiscus trionum]
MISNLEKLHIDDCEAIENIVSPDEGGSGTSWSSFSVKSLTLQYLPKLVHIADGAQTKLLFEYIRVYDCPRLKQIFVDSELKQTLKEI